MRARSQDGIMLLEALLAVVLLAIGLLGTIGLQAGSYSALSDAGMRAEATMAADKLLGVMTTDLDHAADYKLAANGARSQRLAPWYDETRLRIPGAAITVDVAPVAGTSRSQVDIEIKWQRKAGDKQNTHRITSYIAGSI